MNNLKERNKLFNDYKNFLCKNKPSFNKQLQGLKGGY